MDKKDIRIEDLMKLRTSSGNDELEPAEFDKLVSEITAMRQKLAQQEDIIENLKEDVATDSLTNLANRRIFERELARSLAAAERYGRTHALLMVDVNDFKTINDSLGHNVGDAVLQHIARLLEQNTRPTDVVARLGGDEFCIILNELKIAENGEMRAQNITETIAHTPYIGPKKTVPVSVSIGCYVFGADDTLEDIIRRADKDMYAQKAKHTQSFDETSKPA